MAPSTTQPVLGMMSKFWIKHNDGSLLPPTGLGKKRVQQNVSLIPVLNSEKGQKEGCIIGLQKTLETVGSTPDH